MSSIYYFKNGYKEEVKGDPEFTKEHIDNLKARPEYLFTGYPDQDFVWNNLTEAWEPAPVVPWRLYWLSGETEVIHGTSIANAFNKKYGGGALRALDWYDTKEEQTHDWDKDKREWVPRKSVFNHS